MNQDSQKINDVNHVLASREADHSWSDAVDRLKYATEYAQAGLKGLFLANGAAIVSLLTLLGNSKEIHPGPTGIWWAFVWFSLGLAAVLLTYILGYFAHGSYYQSALNFSRQADRAAHGMPQDTTTKDFGELGNWAENVGIILVLFSLIFFVTGAFVALGAIT